jgi:hypothetical protein
VTAVREDRLIMSEMTPAAQYGLFGLRVRSDFPLPLDQVGGYSNDSWSFRRGHGVAPSDLGPSLAELPSPSGPIVIRHRARGAEWLRYPGIATFRTDPATRIVDVYLDGKCDHPALPYILCGQVAILILRLSGLASLHASAVVTRRGTAAFLGAHGQGKSSVAAAFLSRGAALLTDDVLPVRVVDGSLLGGPGLPLMKLWPDSVASALRIEENLSQLLPECEKRLFRLSSHYPRLDGSTPIDAFYVLRRRPETDPSTEVSIARLPAAQALSSLVTNASGAPLMTRDELGGFFVLCSAAIASAPVALLDYPTGYEHHDSLLDAVLNDLPGL